MGKIIINSLKDINKYQEYIPAEALRDIEKRSTDWLASGGKINDQYIMQQCKYAERIVNFKFKNRV